MTRDQWRCRVPICQSRKNLHAHHVQFRSQLGDDIDKNLISVCNDCHELIHRSFIQVEILDETQGTNVPVKWKIFIESQGVMKELNG